MILVESDVSGEWDSSGGWPALAERAVRAAVEVSDFPGALESDLAVEISVKFTGDEEVHALNREWRGKDKPTNVLTFPMIDDSDMVCILLGVAKGELLLGDIVLARGVCVREAEEKGISVQDHAAHLIVHGTLHLLAYDHEVDEGEAEHMEEVERRALAGLGIADPYLLAEVQH